MNETEFYAALTLIAASAGAALASGYLTTRKANMLKATIFLLICSVAVGMAGCREPRPAKAASLPPVMAPAAAQSTQKQVPPLPKRHAAPPRRCSMVAYLVI